MKLIFFCISIHPLRLFIHFLEHTLFNGLISVNELGRFIWENYEKAKDEDELLGFILDEYEVERDVAKADLDEFLDILRKNEIV